MASPGALQHSAAKSYVDDYTRRLARVVAIERHQARQSKRRKGGVDRRAKSNEGQALLSILPKAAVVVALSPEGRVYDSDAFLAWFMRQVDGGVRDLAFVIGGPDGLDDCVLEAARFTISLSPMTLPHELAEVVVMEQLYRAVTRWKKLPYHR